MVVDTLGQNLGEVAKGDLTAEIAREFPADYAELKTNFNAALTSLRIADRLGGWNRLRRSTPARAEIAQASEDLARRTEANAASLEETSAAVTQMDERLKTMAARPRPHGGTGRRRDLDRVGRPRNRRRSGAGR